MAGPTGPTDAGGAARSSRACSVPRPGVRSAAPPPHARGLGGPVRPRPIGARPPRRTPALSSALLGTARPARPYLALLGAQPVHRVVHRQPRAAAPRHRQRPPPPRPARRTPQRRRRHGRSPPPPRAQARLRPAPAGRPPPAETPRLCSAFNEPNPPTTPETGTERRTPDARLTGHRCCLSPPWVPTPRGAATSWAFGPPSPGTKLDKQGPLN